MLVHELKQDDENIRLPVDLQFWNLHKNLVLPVADILILRYRDLNIISSHQRLERRIPILVYKISYQKRLYFDRSLQFFVVLFLIDDEMVDLEIDD